MRSASVRYILISVMGVILSCIAAGFCRADASLDAPHDAPFGGVGCISCHDMTAYDQPNLIPDTGPPADIDDCNNNRTCMVCHEGVTAAAARCHSSLTTSDKYGTWRVGCSVCHNQHTQEQDRDFGTTYGKFVRRYIDRTKILDYAPPTGVTVAGKSGRGAVRFTASAGPGSFVDGGSTIDGICQVCHTRTNHFRNTGEVNVTSNGYDHTGTIGTDCMSCHDHSKGFAHGGGSGTGCNDCHGHDAGTRYDPDMTVPYTPGETVSPGNGTFQSHSTHTETDADDLKGPGLYCADCHDIYNFPYFVSGSDVDGDGKFSLTETDVCNTCHSPGGTYDGVDDPVVGAKKIWKTGAYIATDNATLHADKLKWCATCHDEDPSQIKAVFAPEVIGDEDGAYKYGTGWGYYKTGHGLEAGEQYPSKGGVETLGGRPVECDSCHDYATMHVDGTPRTYVDGDISGIDPALYRQGYRLKLIDGQEPMRIPRPFGTANSADLFRVCFQVGCHDSGPYIDSNNMNTNLVTDGFNRHVSHLVQVHERYKSDWAGENNSGITCVTCHNVHGSTQLAMIRDGKLIGHEPGLQIWYKNDAVTHLDTPPDPEDLPLPASDGTAWIGASSINLCVHCHSWGIRGEDRIPFQDVSQAPLLEWVGTSGLTSDGVVPDSAVALSVFTFRVSYSDGNNDSPDPIEVWVDLDDNGSYEAGEKFAMTETEALDTALLNGKTFTKSLSIAKAGDGILNYRFYALDGVLEATGTPTVDSTVSILNNAPTLAWTGEDFYLADGVNPDTGGDGYTFTFRIDYIDRDDEAPATIQVWIDENEDESYEADEKFNLAEVDNGDTTYSDGKRYALDLPLAYDDDGNFKYRFYAADMDAEATGKPTLDSVLTVQAGTNSSPFMEFMDGGCTVSGVKPGSGADGAEFVFTVRYVDPEGVCPPGTGDIQLWIDADDNLAYGTSEKHDLAEVDAGDTDCTDGKIYSITRTLTLAGDNALSYRFYATDGIDTAVGEPAIDHGVTVIDALKVRPAGGPGWYTTIQEAIDAVDNAHTVLTYEGTYNEDIVFDRFNDNNTTLRSVCGPDLTIINGSGSGSTVTFTRNVGNLLDGFQVTGGITGISVEGSQTAVNNCRVHGMSNGLGGINVVQSGDMPRLTLTNSEIYENASDRGAGVRIWRGTGHTISDSIIRNNAATGDSLADGGGGVHIFQVDEITISNSIISDNSTIGYPGGGLYVTQVSQLTISDSVIRDNTSDNSGGGLYNDLSTISIVRSSVTGNTAASMGGAIRHPSAGSNALFENCVVADNRAAQGGMAFINGGNFDIINSTIANNQATVSNSGMMYNQLATVTIRNSILWGNRAATVGHIAHFNGGSITITDSIIQSGDDGNFTNEPFFTSAGTTVVSGFASEDDPWFMGSGDYHIQAFSSAIDNASGTYAPVLDIDGQSRPQGAADDIGADEYYP